MKNLDLIWTPTTLGLVSGDWLLVEYAEGDDEPFTLFNDARAFVTTFTSIEEAQAFAATQL